MTNEPMIPTALASLHRWLVWRAEVRDGRTTKVPYQARDPRHHASSTDPATWGSLATAAAALARDPTLAGLGLALGDGLAGVDLDHCRDAATDAVTSAAAAVVARLNSYTEASPSGTGLHILLLADVPAGRRAQLPDGGGGLEIYGAGRYFTFTGQRLDALPADIQPRQREIDALLHDIEAARPTPAAPTGPSAPVALDDAELLARIRASRQAPKFDRLWRGDTAGYPTRSEADMALASILAWWCNGDAARTERLLRASGLARPAWDEPRPTVGCRLGYTLRAALRQRPPGSGYAPGRRPPPPPAPSGVPHRHPALDARAHHSPNRLAVVLAARRAAETTGSRRLSNRAHNRAACVLQDVAAAELVDDRGIRSVRPLTCQWACGCDRCAYVAARDLAEFVAAVPATAWRARDYLAEGHTAAAALANLRRGHRNLKPRVRTVLAVGLTRLGTSQLAPTGPSAVGLTLLYAAGDARAERRLANSTTGLRAIGPPRDVPRDRVLWEVLDACRHAPAWAADASALGALEPLCHRLTRFSANRALEIHLAALRAKADAARAAEPQVHVVAIRIDLHAALRLEPFLAVEVIDLLEGRRDQTSWGGPPVVATHQGDPLPWSCALDYAQDLRPEWRAAIDASAPEVAAPTAAS